LVEVAGRAGADRFGIGFEAFGLASGSGGFRGAAHPDMNNAVLASSVTATGCGKKFLVLWSGRQDEFMSG
jgi:hypothetical protein